MSVTKCRGANFQPARVSNLYRYISVGLLLVAILLVGILFYRVMAGFFLPLFLAALLTVIFQPLHRRMVRWVRGRQRVAAAVTTIVILLLVLLPLMLIGIFAAAEARSVIKKFDPPTLMGKLRGVRDRLRLEMPAAEDFTRIEMAMAAMRSQSLPPNAGQQRDQLLYDSTELRAYARDLAVDLQLEWPDSPEQAEPAAGAGTVVQAWNRFALPIETIRAALSDASWQAVADTEQQQEVLANARENFQLALKRFVDFKTTLLGGPVRAWFTELANPDEQEVRTYFESVGNWVQSKLLSYGSATTQFVIRFAFGLVIMSLAMFAFFLDGPGMLAGLKQLSPLDDAYEDELISEFQNVSRAVVLATLFSAIAQGLLGAIGYYLAGLEPVVLLMLLTATLALVPFVGAAAVWVPCSLYLVFVDGRLGAGIFLAVYGALIISMADNVIKPLVLHGQSNLHPLLALLSVLGGVAALGPVGILVGPMVVAFLETLLRILQRELSEMERQTPPGQPGTGNL